MTDKNASILLASGNIRSPRGRLSYPYLFTPQPPRRGQVQKPDAKLKYTTTLLLPPGVDLTVAKKAVADAAKEKFGDKLQDELFLKKFKLPFIKAEEVMKDFNGWTVLRLSSVNKPGVIDHRGQAITEPREVYAGRWAFVSMNPFAYDVEGNRGVSFGVINVQLLEHDTPLAASNVQAEKEFAPVEIDGETQSTQPSANSAPKTAADIFG